MSSQQPWIGPLPSEERTACKIFLQKVLGAFKKSLFLLTFLQTVLGAFYKNPG